MMIGLYVLFVDCYLPACPGSLEVITGDGPLPMAIFELLEYIVNEVMGCIVLHAGIVVGLRFC